MITGGRMHLVITFLTERRTGTTGNLCVIHSGEYRNRSDINARVKLRNRIHRYPFRWVAYTDVGTGSIFL
eukprot:4142050-Pyramimonas_sp.AAC.3